MESVKQHWPLLVVLLLGVLAWADLRRELNALRTSPPFGPVPGVHTPREAESAAAGVADAGITGDAGAASCDGELTEEAVRVALGRSGRAVFDCFERRREVIPALRGTLNVELRVGREGRVEDARVSGPLAQDAALVSCVRSSALSWRFAPLPQGTCAIVSAPFLLGVPAGGPVTMDASVGGPPAPR